MLGQPGTVTTFTLGFGTFPMYLRHSLKKQLLTVLGKRVLSLKQMKGENVIKRCIHVAVMSCKPTARRR
jgi:hypothetical protein